jgi:transcriptional antiterminator RfaH
VAEGAEVGLRWYVLRSKPRKEAALQRFARQNGHEVFFPTIPARPVNPRASRIAPYFPGYLFVHTDLGAVGAATFHWMPYSTGLVQVGGEPGVVQDVVVRSIAARVREIWGGGELLPDRFHHGDRVVVREGAFEGYRALFDVRLPGTERVRVLLKMLNDRYVPMEIGLELLERDGQGAVRYQQLARC